jgi:hypothetical protein
MMRKIVILSSFLAIGCAPKGSFDGKLIDPVTGKGRAGVTMLLLSPTNPSPACMELEGVTGDDGSFHIEGLCANGDYTLDSRDKTFVIEDIGAVPGGVMATGTKEIHGWPAPKGEGLFVFDGAEFTKLREGPPIGLDGVKNSEAEVIFPDTLPKKVAVVANDAWLVFAGDKFTERYRFDPLIYEPGKARMASSSPQAWWYVGGEFTGPTTFEPRNTELDQGKVKSLDQGDQHLRFVPGDAVPNGFYVSYYDNFREDKRYRKFYMVNMGPVLKAPGEE